VNHYEVLGVPMGADPAEIQRAYRRLARRHHPDFHAAADAATQDRNRRRMQEVNEAWSVLGDSARRRRYDDQVRAGTAGTGEAMPVGSHGPVTPPGKGWTPRPDDDAWMSDFEAWRSETDRLPPEPVPTRSSTTQGVVAVLPIHPQRQDAPETGGNISRICALTSTYLLASFLGGFALILLF